MSPIHLAAPICLDAPVSLDAAICLDVPPVCLGAPICLDGPCMFGCSICFDTTMFYSPYMFGCLFYVWVPPMFGHLSMVGCHHMFGHPLYVWMPSICLADPCIIGCCQMYGGIQRYEEHPNIWVHPNVWGAYGHPLSLTKHAFFMLYMYSRHPNIFQTCMCLDVPPVCLNAPVCLDAPIFLDEPCMFWCPHMFGWPPVCLDAPYV